jgi:NADPH-dependent curcumin reductase CurA
MNYPAKLLQTLVPMIQSGQIKWSKQRYDGIGSVGEAIVAVQSGANTAKVVVKVGDA